MKEADELNSIVWTTLQTRNKADFDLGSDSHTLQAAHKHQSERSYDTEADLL